MLNFSPYKLMRLLPAIFMTALVMGACNEKSDDEPAYEPAISVAVQSFSINANSKVLENLDSVFFSIDLEHGVIFNADSLPVGTAIDRLVPKITFPAAVSKAEINMTGGQTRTGVVDYKTSPTDSIDFSGRVTLTLSTDDNALSRTYEIKVNVHKMVADSLMWDRSALAPLPSAAPRSQRTVEMADRIFCLSEESDGTYAISSTDDITSGRWNVTPVQMGFTPQVRSLTATSSALYILDSTGKMYSSADAIAWSATPMIWHAIIGPFGDAVLGIVESRGKLCHDIYPRPAGFEPTPLESDFPAEGFSNFNSFTSKWAADPIGFFTGGIRDGRTTADTWAYDGDSWAKISNQPLPAMSGALLIPYFNYRQTATSWVQTEFSVCLAIGGRLADGSLNRTVYLSYDNGVNWIKAESLLQLPAYIPSLYDADAIIRTTSMNADLGANWRQLPQRSPHDVSRINYFVDGADVSWECPYIYLFGGMQEDGKLNPSIWRAVLARLTFAPLF